jgi:hypothetical protein
MVAVVVAVTAAACLPASRNLIVAGAPSVSGGQYASGVGGSVQ